MKKKTFNNTAVNSKTPKDSINYDSPNTGASGGTVCIPYGAGSVSWNS